VKNTGVLGLEFIPNWHKKRKKQETRKEKKRKQESRKELADLVHKKHKPGGVD
jgi:hypothetical protein